MAVVTNIHQVFKVEQNIRIINIFGSKLRLMMYNITCLVVTNLT